MLLFIIILDTNSILCWKRMSQLCPKEPSVLSQCTPRWGALGYLFSTHQTVNIYRSMQDPQALESLKCRYYIVVQTGILAKLLTHNRNMQ